METQPSSLQWNCTNQRSDVAKLTMPLSCFPDRTVISAWLMDMWHQFPELHHNESSTNCSQLYMSIPQHEWVCITGKVTSSPASGQCFPVHKAPTCSHSFQRILAEKLRNEVLGIWGQCIISFWPGNFIWGQKETWHFLPASQLIWITIHTPTSQSAALRTAPEA